MAGKQLKLNELKRVVNVDIMKRYASILEDESQNASVTELSRILDELGKKTPSRDVLMKTRLGFILKDVSTRKTLPKSIRDKASQVRTKWKEFHKRLLLSEKYDVKCDKPTTEQRHRTKQALARAFKCDLDDDDDEKLMSALEFCLFKYCDSLINTRYFSVQRHLIRAILSNDNSDIIAKFLGGHLNANELISQCLNTGIKVKEEKEDDVNNNNFQKTKANPIYQATKRSIDSFSPSSNSANSISLKRNKTSTTTLTAARPSIKKSLSISDFLKKS